MPKSPAPVAEMLQKAAIFSKIPPASTARLADRLRRVRHAAGEQIFRPDQPAERFYIILSGRVRVYLISPKGEQQGLHLFGPGEAFAEAAVLTGGDYPAFAEALEQTELVAVRRIDLIEAIRSDADVAIGMLAGLSAKLHEFATLIERLSLQEVPARLAGALIEMSEAAGAETFQLPGTKKQLAGRLGTVSETLSRAFAKLRKQGLIEVNGSQIVILDPDALADAAAGF
ncbi:MAG: Crp/Fnr family transcriptional regulator [Phycisphaerae bacterium]